MTMSISRRVAAGAAAAALLTLAACSSGTTADNSSTAAATDTTAAVTSAPAGTSSGAAVPSQSGQSSGQTGGAASAFKVDVDQCDDPEAVTAKVTGTWKIGYSLPLSGPVAGVVRFAQDGFKARIAAENAAGGINGVKIDVTFKDDAFTPDRAKANLTEFLQQDKVDSVVTFGSGPVGAMADDQNAACVPLLYPSSSVAQYRDISQYPWTVQFLPSADAEAMYDVKLITQKFPGGATVGIAENQTASGKGYSAAFQKAATGTNVKVAVVAPSTDPTAAATQIKAKNVDAVFIAGITSDCGPVVQALARVGFTPKLVINPSNCADETGYIAAGQAADGGVLPMYLKNPADPALKDDAGVKEYLAQVTTDDKNNSITVAGWLTADLTINTLKQAAASPQGLTRQSVIEAARDQEYASPMLMSGITWKSSPTQLLGFSGFQTMVWSAKDKAFKPEGPVIGLG